MKERLIKLRFKIDRMALRERIILLSASIGLLIVIWLFLFYFPQTDVIGQNEAAIAKAQTETTTLLQKRKNIENIASDNTVVKLVAKFDHLKIEMQQLEEKTRRYNQRFISEQELAKLLYSILQQTGGLSIENFSNEDSAPNVTLDLKKLQSVATSAAATPDKTSSTKEKTAIATTEPPPANNQEQPPRHVNYSLTLKGDYFVIMAYLQRLEQLSWQFYWDKLDYKVQTYPQAIAIVQFYTLKPPAEPAATQPGGV